MNFALRCQAAVTLTVNSGGLRLDLSISLEGRWLRPSLIGRHLGESPLMLGDSKTSEGSGSCGAG